MPNLKMDPDWLDAQCELYEDNWKSNRSGPEAVVAFALESLQPTDARLPLLLEPLIEVDIDRVWMDWRTKVSNHNQEHSPAEWCEQLALVPKLRDYLAAIATRNVNFSATESLLRKEYDARQTWGDAPRWDIVDSPWPNWSKLIRKPARHRVEIQSTEFPIPRIFDLCGLTEFGRQRSTDEESGAIVHEASVSRVIISNRTDATISRRQFRLQILSGNHAILTNLSQTNPLPINAAMMLESEAMAIVELPFAFRIQELRLRFT